MSGDDVVIVGAKRTPVGQFQGALSSVAATELGSHAIKHALSDAHILPEQIDEVYMGCVLPAGLGQAPARQAALGAGLPEHVPCTTVNKMCGSGMKAIMIGFQSLMGMGNQLLVCGGLESMSNAPYLLPKARDGLRMGHGEVKDHMFLDGLEDAYDKGRLMGSFADETARKYGFTREDQDDFAIRSTQRAQKAISDGLFANEIAPFEVKTRKGTDLVEHDEGPSLAKLDKIPLLKPAFGSTGTVTAANASSISDGAAAVAVTTRAHADKLGLKPLARISGVASFARKPSEFAFAPVGATEKLLGQLGWRVEDVDLFEINEAFAVVPMAVAHDLHISMDKINIYGGAVTLGHPIGASGARIVCTLLNALRNTGQKRGVASLCIGGGEATAIGVELI